MRSRSTLFGKIARETQAVPVRIGHHELSCSPGCVTWRLGCCDAASSKLREARVRVRDDEVHRASNLAVSGVLSEKEGLSGSGELDEQRIARLELMLPVNSESKAANVERQALGRVGHAKLRDNGLRHHAPSIAPRGINGSWSL